MVAQGIQFQLIVGGDLPQFGDVEGGQSGPAGNQNRLGCLARGQLVKTVLPHRKVIRLALGKVLEHEVHWILKFLVVLPHLHDVEQFQQGRKVPFFDRRFIVDIGNKRVFCLLPKRIGPFSLTAGVCHKGRNQFQDVLLAVNIVEGVVMHRLLEVDGIEDFDAVAFLQKTLPTSRTVVPLGKALSRYSEGISSEFLPQKLAVLTSSSIKRFILSSKVSFAVLLK